MPSSDDDESEWSTDAAEHESPAGQDVHLPPGQPDPAALAAAEEALDHARSAFERAQLEREEADDATADAEGVKAVAEFKEADAEDDPDQTRWRRAQACEDRAKADRDLRRAITRLARATTKAEAAEEALGQAEAAWWKASTTPAPPPPPPEPPRFATVELFVERFVLPNWVHKYVAKQVRWCDKWWEHAEAITRLEAMWEAFEVMRLQPPPSLSTWLRDHFDVHMRTLTDPEGVFYNCEWKQGFHEPSPAWNLTPAPEGMFAGIEAAQVQPTPATSPVSEPGGSPAQPVPADLSAHHVRNNTHTKGARP